MEDFVSYVKSHGAVKTVDSIKTYSGKRSGFLTGFANLTTKRLGEFKKNLGLAENIRKKDLDPTRVSASLSLRADPIRAFANEIVRLDGKGDLFLNKLPISKVSKDGTLDKPSTFSSLCDLIADNVSYPKAEKQEPPPKEKPKAAEPKKEPKDHINPYDFSRLSHFLNPDEILDEEKAFESMYGPEEGLFTDTDKPRPHGFIAEMVDEGLRKNPPRRPISPSVIRGDLTPDQESALHYNKSAFDSWDYETITDPIKNLPDLHKRKVQNLYLRLTKLNGSLVAKSILGEICGWYDKYRSTQLLIKILEQANISPNKDKLEQVLRESVKALKLKPVN
jgi:hypothetical protein